MKAIVQDKFGSADVLEFRDVADPVGGEDDILVQVPSGTGSRFSIGSSAPMRRAGAWHSRLPRCPASMRR